MARNLVLFGPADNNWCTLDGHTYPRPHTK